MKFLLVDDSNMMVSVLRNFVSKIKTDATFVEAHNGEDAIQKYKEERPDMVFLDIVMPQKDGFEALEAIKAENPSAKVVMCTSLKEKEQEDKAKQLGAVAYITKPFGSDDIKKVIEEHA